MQTRTRPDVLNLVSTAVLILAVVVAGVVLVLLVRLERGLFGIVLAGVAIALMGYWLREFRRMAKRELGVRNPPKKEWNYDLRVGKGEITFISEVPGPAEAVDALVVERILRVKGGDNFEKEIGIHAEAEIIAKSYVNGVLHLKLRKILAN